MYTCKDILVVCLNIRIVFDQSIYEINIFTSLALILIIVSSIFQIWYVQRLIESVKRGVLG